MIGQAFQWPRTPSTTPLHPKKWNPHFCITFNIWCWPDWSMDLNLIHHLSPANKMKCSFLGYVQLLMISQAVQWTQTPSATPLQPIKWNAHFWITFNFWWSAGLVDGLEPHPSPASSKKMKCSYFDYVQLLMIGQAGQWTQTPSTTPLQPIKWNASFWIMFTSDDQPGWLMDSNPICHPSPAKKMKCSLLDYVHFGWSARLVNGLKPHPPPLSSQKKWNAHFWIMFNFWWSAGLVNGLKPHLPPLSYKKNEMLIFQIHSTSDDQPGWSMDSNPIHHPSPPKKIKCSFLGYVQLLMISWAVRWTQTPSTTPLQPIKWNAHILIMFNFWWLARLFNGLEHHTPPLSTQKNGILIFVLRSTSDVGQTGQWTQTPSTTPLQPIKWNASFWIMFNFWWSARLVDGLKPHLPPLSSQRNEMLIFVLCSTFSDQLGWSMDSNPIHHPSPPKETKCSFLDYV